VCRVCDTVVNPDLEAVNLRSIHLLFCLFCHGNCFKVEEGKSTGPLARPIQDHVHLLNAAKLAERSVEVGIGRVEVEAEHPDAAGGSRVLTVSFCLGWPWMCPAPTL